MRIAILADIHGNLIALEEVMRDIEKQAPDQIWCGGDLAWLGPRGQECVTYVREAGWPTIKGNTDVWVTGDPQTIEDEEERQVHIGIAAAHEISEDDSRWLISLPFGHSGPGSLLMVHGTPESPFTAPFPNDPPSEFTAYEGKAALVIYAHVHIPFVRRLHDDTVVANPGSVGLPNDGRYATYMIIDQRGPDWTIRHRHIAFDIDAVVEQSKSFGGPASERFLSMLA